MADLQTLVFNSTKKTVEVTRDARHGVPTYSFDNIKTVKCMVGYYEVIQSTLNSKNEEMTYPVLRVPISITNMEIIK